MRVSPRAIISAISLILLCASPFAFSEIYTWVDENGKKHFGDEIPEKYKSQGSEYKISETNTAPAVVTKKKKNPGSLKPVDLRPQSAQKPDESYLPKPKEKTCAELKQEYLTNKHCFAACRSANGGNLSSGGCPGCTNMKKPKC
ncbi:MAG: DUF4124 domain-containing protein [Halieaceae bacterium]